MNIAYVCSDFGIPIHGHKGAAIHVREFATAMHRLGHRLEIVTPRAGGDPTPDFPARTIELGRFGPDRSLLEHLKQDPAGGEATAREVRAMLYNSALPHLAGPALAQPPDAIYERYSLFGSGGVALARALDVPHVLEVNAPLSLEQARHRGSAFTDAAARIEREIFAATSQIVTVSAHLRDWIVGLGIPADRVTVTPNGVDLDRFATGAHGRHARRAALGIGQRPVIGFVGTLKAWHGTASLLRAFALLDPAAHLLIVGEGPERSRLEELARELGIAARTTFTGAVPHSEIPAWIAAMDVAVAPYDPSPDHYFSPLKVFEYMAAAKPIVAARIGQIAEVLDHGRTALLYEPGNDRDLAVRLAGLLADPALAADLATAARAEAEARYAWERNALTVTGLIQCELDARSRHLVPERAA